MDPLTAAVLAVLTAYVTKNGERLLDEAGEASFNLAKRLFGRLKQAWSGDDSRTRELEEFEKEPDTYAPVLAKRVTTSIEADPELREELQALVDEAKPQLEIFQTIAKSVGVTGLDVETMSSGKGSVNQKIDESQNVTGARVKKFGR